MKKSIGIAIVAVLMAGPAFGSGSSTQGELMASSVIGGTLLVGVSVGASSAAAAPALSGAAVVGSVGATGLSALSRDQSSKRRPAALPVDREIVVRSPDRN